MKEENKKEGNVDRQMLLFWGVCGVLGNMESPSWHESKVSKELSHPNELVSLFHSLQRKRSTKEFQLAGFRRRAFFVLSPALWNILTLEVRSAPTLLKTWPASWPGAIIGVHNGDGDLWGREKISLPVWPVLWLLVFI